MSSHGGRARRTAAAVRVLGATPAKFGVLNGSQHLLADTAWACKRFESRLSRHFAISVEKSLSGATAALEFGPPGEFEWRSFRRRSVARRNRRDQRPGTTSAPARTRASFLPGSRPARSVRSVRSRATICDTLATEGFDSPVARTSSDTFPGAFDHLRLLVNGIHTIVPIRLRLRDRLGRQARCVPACGARRSR